MKTIARDTARIAFAWALLIVIGASMSGCHLDSFFDPSKTGYFEATPTSVPILDKLDVIERDDSYWSNATEVRPADLVPNDLSYRLAPADVVTVEILSLLAPGQWTSATRRIDASGTLRLPELGDVPAAGMTAQEFQDLVKQLVSETVLTTDDPQVEVVVEEGSGLMYTVYGFLQSPGRYLIRDPDLRLIDALAVAGGVPATTKRVYVIRAVSLSGQSPAYEQRLREFREGREGATPPDNGGQNIEDLIRELDQPGALQDASLGMFQDGLVDIDDFGQPAATPVQDPAVDIDQLRPRGGGGATYIYDETRGEWIAVDAPSRSGGGDSSGTTGSRDGDPMVVERVIEVDYQRLSQGDMSLNVVIRPDDLIYVAGPKTGVVYIGGEVARSGVYQLPVNGELTLSRLVTAAGGLNAIAIPERVDLVRVVGRNREAAVRLNLAAIRQRTEPDVHLKPDDHIIVGTSWVAAPLAVIRNGFRATYGFGFLLDRNFGNDVFGAPPTNRQGF